MKKNLFTFLFLIREVVDIFIFAGIFQKVAEMSLKKVVDRGYIFIFFIFIVFLLTNIFNFFKKSLKFQMFKFLSLIFVRFTKSHWKSRWFSKNFCRNFPTFRRPTTPLDLIVNSPFLKNSKLRISWNAGPHFQGGIFMSDAS